MWTVIDFSLALRYAPLTSIAETSCPSNAEIARIIYTVVRFTVGELILSYSETS